MKHFSLFTAATLVVVILMGTGTAVAGPLRTPSIAGQYYLDAVCPANAASGQVTAAWKASGLPKRVKFGTPFPSTLLEAYHRLSKALAREGMLLHRYRAWPVSVNPQDIQRLVEADYADSVTADGIYRTGTVRKSTPGWRIAKSEVQESVQRVRIALGLPPSGQGCPGRE